MNPTAELLLRASRAALADANPAWHPVGDWLYLEAARMQESIEIWSGSLEDRAPVDDPPPPGLDDPEWVARQVAHHYRHPLNVARALLEGANR